jgi:nitrogen fixation protein
VQKLRGFITWLKNGSDLKFRHLSRVNIGGNGGGGMVSSGRKFLAGELVADFFLRRSVKKLRGFTCLLENGSDLKFRHLSMLT